MSLTLLLETSSHRYSLGLLEAGELVGYRETSRSEPDFDGIAGLAAAELAGRGATVRDLDGIGVDIGPGNLTSVRSGIAYGNALARSLRLPIAGADSLRLLALQVAAAGSPVAGSLAGEPVLCLRKAGGTAVYAGLFGPPGAPRYAVGEIATVLKTLARELPAVRLAGAFRDRVPGLLPGVAVTDSGLELPDARALALEPGMRRPQSFDLLHPLTETSGIFHEHDD